MSWGARLKPLHGTKAAEGVGDVLGIIQINREESRLIEMIGIDREMGEAGGEAKASTQDQAWRWEERGRDGRG